MGPPCRYSRPYVGTSCWPVVNTCADQVDQGCLTPAIKLDDWAQCMIVLPLIYPFLVLDSSFVIPNSRSCCKIQLFFFTVYSIPIKYLSCAVSSAAGAITELEFHGTFFRTRIALTLPGHGSVGGAAAV